MTRIFPDGTVELMIGCAMYPPGHIGQHAGIGTWFRVDGGDWEHASPRSMHKNMQCLECADSVAEFRQYLEIV